MKTTSLKFTWTYTTNYCSIYFHTHIYMYLYLPVYSILCYSKHQDISDIKYNIINYNRHYHKRSCSVARNPSCLSQPLGIVLPPSVTRTPPTTVGSDTARHGTYQTASPSQTVRFFERVRCTHPTPHSSRWLDLK